jgi:hypothetical protein
LAAVSVAAFYPIPTPLSSGIGTTPPSGLADNREARRCPASLPVTGELPRGLLFG